jgi:uncharacterized protein
MRAIPAVHFPFLAPALARSGEAIFLWKVYRWMAFGLAISGSVALLAAKTPGLVLWIVSSRVALFGLMAAELLMVVLFVARARHMTFGAAALMFISYAALNGVTMAMIFLVYAAATVGQVFFVCAGAFAALSLYGASTQRDLTALGKFMFIGLVGLLLASFVNAFLDSSTIYWGTSYGGVLIFAGLTAYDNQRLRRMYVLQGEQGNLALQGALTLYLDFINLFLMLLRVAGGRR